MKTQEKLRFSSEKFNKVVLWGFKSKWHTHRFIFQAYYNNLKKNNVPVIWVDDLKKNQGIIEKGDLIFSAGGMHGKMIPEKNSLEDYNIPIRDDVYYCLHAEKDFLVNKISKERYLILKFYNNEAERYHKISEAVHFDDKTKTLYQPWGTDLRPQDFKKPTFSKIRIVFWIGSVWKGTNKEGNINQIHRLQKILANNKIIFISTRFIPNFFNRILIRNSRLAPAIGGDIQVETNYLPCRMFKNISYGQLGFSNIEKFNDILKDCNIYDKDMDIMVKKVLSLTKAEYLSIIKKQQKAIEVFTIEENLNNIFNYIQK